MAIEAYRDAIHRCFRCGYCKFTNDCSHVGFNCPLYNKRRFETHSPGGLMWLIYASLAKRDLAWNERLTKLLYSCTMCRNCVEQCRFKFSEDLVNIFKAAREEVVESQLLPPLVKRFLNNIFTYGNPYKQTREDKGNWAKGTAIKQYREGDEFLYYVGCVGSYDTTAMEAARALGDVLTRAHVSFGILGGDEDCDGNEVDMLGERGLFEWLRDKNTQKFKDLGIKKIVVLSPHSYNAMKNNYRGEFEVFHYSQLIRDLILSGKLQMTPSSNIRVVYHDPCFLGRYNGQYDAPREVLLAIPGVELLEMERNRENSFCCGGGGGNFYTDMLGGGADSPSRVRVREAHATGANVLAVACPICMMMLKDALKAEALEEEVIVKDISQIVRESLA
jgi:Fe-S oxidoreductase